MAPPIRKKVVEVVSVLHTAHEIVHGDREKTYGSPDKNLNTIADYWTVHLRAKYGIEFEVSIDDVCGMMMLMKQARLATSPNHTDSIVDICGYAALQDICQKLA